MDRRSRRVLLVQRVLEFSGCVFRGFAGSAGSMVRRFEMWPLVAILNPWNP